MNNQKLAACYIRVSTDMQLEYSPASQLRLIKDYAERNNLTILEEHIYEELGVSGKKAAKRPAFLSMITAAKQKLFDVILIYHSNRFARNHEESIVYKSMLKRDCGVELISVTQPPVDKKTDMLTSAIYAVMDEWYSMDLSDNVTRGMTEKALKGGYQAPPPYGYRVISPKSAPEPVKEEADVVRLIFSLFLEGGSPWHIGKKISAMGFLTRRGNAWESRAVEYILKNPFYKGLVVWNRRGANQTPNPPEEWITAQGHHKAIISAEDFERASLLLDSRRALPRVRPAEARKHWLSGLLKCAHCGSTLSLSLSSSPHFSCGGYKKGKCSFCNSISLKKSEKAVEIILKVIAAQSSPIPMFPSAAKNNNYEHEIKALITLLQKNEKKFARVKSAYSEGIDTLEEYRANKEGLLSEKKELTEKISALKKEIPMAANPPGDSKFAGAFYEQLPSADISNEEKNLLIKKLFSRIVYDKDKLCIEVFFAF